MTTPTDDQLRSFKAAFDFALRAAMATYVIPADALEEAIAVGEALVRPGVPLDDALEFEFALRVLRPVLAFRKALDEIPQLKPGGLNGDGC